jgi:cobyrinic acid a,c-diamide synthase
LLPGRHLGLVPPTEFSNREKVVEKLNEIAVNYLDIERIIEIASDVSELETTSSASPEETTAQVRIGYFDDAVFTFYYPENLEALRKHGAQLVPVSSLADSTLPEIDALYIGGGFPETHASRLVENRSLMESVKSAAVRGLPIYAECGGLIYLCRSLKWNNSQFPMAGVFPIDLEMRIRPVGHGYTVFQADGSNPYFEVGAVIKGHEFHYSGVVSEIPESMSCLKVDTGVGLGNHRDGLIANRTLACYTHIHADGAKGWAAKMIEAARQYGEGTPGHLPGGNNRPAANHV